MNLDLPADKYLVAVSGGVDSIVLLDMLVKRAGGQANEGVSSAARPSDHPSIRLIVAHFDHGIREDSKQDRLFVQELAKRYGLPFVYDTAKLGAGVSEAVARRARYAFLHEAQRASGAQAIITAHHQDDALETAIINLLRGTGRKGLSSLANGAGILRPLLPLPKSELLDYAKRHNLQWHEDSTNQDTKYLRNHIRLELLPAWGADNRQRLLKIINRMQGINNEIDDLLDSMCSVELSRKWFGLLPREVALEVMAGWLRRHDIRDFNSLTLERLTKAVKEAEPGKKFDIINRHQLLITRNNASLTLREATLERTT